MRLNRIYTGMPLPMQGFLVGVDPLTGCSSDFSLRPPILSNGVAVHIL
jgi:hypothetical protein